MRRSLVSVATILLFLVPAAAWAQGLLMVVDPNQQVRLPRPIIIWPRPPYPMPRPTPPPMSYKIKELDVQARLIDQVAQVQVSQTFVNTGSLPMEVAFVFPLPYDGAIEQMTLMIDGRSIRPSCSTPRRPGGCTRRSCARTAIRRCWNGWARACSAPTSSRCRPARAAPSRSATRSFAASRRG